MNEIEIKKRVDELIAKADSDIELVFAKMLKEVLQEIHLLYVKYSRDGKEPSYTDLNKYNRLHNMLQRIVETLNEQYREVVVLINNMRKNVYVENYLQQAYLFEVYASTEMGFTIPTNSVIQSALLNPIEFLTLPKVMEQHRNELTRKLQITITQSLIRGDGYWAMTKEIEKAVGFNRNKARLVARTEGGRAMSVSDEKVYDIAKQHANITKMWLSSKDLRVRRSHRKLDTQKADKDGYFHYNGLKAKGPHLWNRADMDIQCRCTTIKLVNGQLPQVMRGRDYTDINYQKKLAERIDLYMEDGDSYAVAFRKANKEVKPPNVVMPFMSYDEWLKSKT